MKITRGHHWIKLQWEGHLLPSTSNNRTIGRTPRGRPFLMKNLKHQSMLNHLSQELKATCLKEGITHLSFKNDEVFVLALFPAKNRIWDSHNMSKALGDWLEDVRIIENDSKAEIICLKKQDYAVFPKETTDIFIIKRGFTAKLIGKLIDDIEQITVS